MSFEFIDLFAGIGGFHIALSELGGTCVFASEIDEAAQSIYRKNFEHEMKGPIVGDIIPLTEKSLSRLIPEHDVLVVVFHANHSAKAVLNLAWTKLEERFFIT